MVNSNLHHGVSRVKQVNGTMVALDIDVLGTPECIMGENKRGMDRTEDMVGETFLSDQLVP